MLPLRKSRRWITVVAPLIGFLLLLQFLRGPQWSLIASRTTLDRSARQPREEEAAARPKAAEAPKLTLQQQQQQQLRNSNSNSNSNNDSNNINNNNNNKKSSFACPRLPGIEDVLVVLKTGVTEALDKVPVHAQTTFRCVPNYVVFSDYSETIGGVPVHDVLQNVRREVRLHVEDFDLYNRLRVSGREGLRDADATEEENGVFGMPNNPGWKLDKWKFLPMIDEALQAKPDAKWFVFMEADTHIVWPNLVAWLARLDSRQPLYLGTETQIGDVLFAHGGSGFILSQTAMRMVSAQYARNVSEYDLFTDTEWAGDMVLGKALKDAGVDLTFTWPLLQNARLGEVEPLTNTFYRQPWCYPVVAFHHLSPADVEDMWRFDQEWFIKKKNNLLLHADVFHERIFPHLGTGVHQDWDNLSGDLVEDASIDNIHDCRRVCEKDGLCRQYSFRWSEEPLESYNYETQQQQQQQAIRPECRTFESPRLGVARPGTQSGWMMTRIEVTMRARGGCEAAEWE